MADTPLLDALAFSFDATNHIYRDVANVQRPSVSQILKAEGIISFDGIRQDVLERKACLGTLVHKVTELYDLGEQLSDYEIPDECLPYVEGWVNFENDTGFRPRLTEHQGLVSLFGMTYGMKLDNEGDVNGEPCIIEKKCGVSEHAAWGVQLAGYDLGLAVLEGRRLEGVKPHRGRQAVQLGPQFPRNYKTFPYKDPADYTVFVNSLANTIWKINKKLSVFENIPERIAA